MEKPKGDVKFDRYKDVIKSRHDRPDPQWHLSIESIDTEKMPIKKQKLATIDIDRSLSRKANDIHSKYPIRLSLEKITNKCKY